MTLHDPHSGRLKREEVSNNFLFDPLALGRRAKEEMSENDDRSTRLVSGSYNGRDDQKKGNTMDGTEEKAIVDEGRDAIQPCENDFDQHLHPTTPQPHDVLLGHGGVRHHTGNMWFRKAVNNKRAEYKRSKKGAKRAIASSIVLSILRSDRNPPSRRFLECREGLWYEASFETALHKTSQALREKRWINLCEHGTAGGNANVMRGEDEDGPTAPTSENEEQHELDSRCKKATGIISQEDRTICIGGSGQKKGKPCNTTENYELSHEHVGLLFHPTVVPRPHDVLLGRGLHHPGNLWFQKVLSNHHMGAYNEECLHQEGAKVAIARSIVQSILATENPSRRFLECRQGQWYEASFEIAVHSTTQALCREQSSAVGDDDGLTESCEKEEENQLDTSPLKRAIEKMLQQDDNMTSIDRNNQKKRKTADGTEEKEFVGDGHGPLQPRSKKDAVVPQAHDVLIGRGGFRCHPGNLWYRAKVNEHRAEYKKSKKGVKGNIARLIVHATLAPGNPSRRFLEFREGRWHEASFKTALQKTSQALREKRNLRVCEDYIAVGHVNAMQKNDDDGQESTDQDASNNTMYPEKDTCSSRAPRFPMLRQNDVAFWDNGLLVDDDKNVPGNAVYRSLLRSLKKPTTTTNPPDFLKSCAYFWMPLVQQKLAKKIVQHVQNQYPPGAFLVYGDHRSKSERGNESCTLRKLMGREEAVQRTYQILIMQPKETSSTHAQDALSSEVGSCMSSSGTAFEEEPMTGEEVLSCSQAQPATTVAEASANSNRVGNLKMAAAASTRTHAGPATSSVLSMEREEAVQRTYQMLITQPKESSTHGQDALSSGVGSCMSSSGTAFEEEPMTGEEVLSSSQAEPATTTTEESANSNQVGSWKMAATASTRTDAGPDTSSNFNGRMTLSAAPLTAAASLVRVPVQPHSHPFSVVHGDRAFIF